MEDGTDIRILCSFAANWSSSNCQLQIDMAMRSESMNDLESCFARVQVRINWGLIATSKISIETIACPLTFGEMFLPWYKCHGHFGGDVDCPDAHPVSLDDVVSDFSSLPHQTRKRIWQYKFIYQNAPPKKILLPAYDLGSSRRLLLDGNHRAVAIHQLGVPVAISLAIIHGPMNVAVLPDLRHWLENGQTSG